MNIHQSKRRGRLLSVTQFLAEKALGIRVTRLGQRVKHIISVWRALWHTLGSPLEPGRYFFQHRLQGLIVEDEMMRLQ